MNENGLNYIDLFAGAGGLSEGFIQSGYRPVAHVEMNEHAAKTIETRIAYYYLKDNGKIKSYYDYEKGKITREQLLEKIPKEELKTVINKEMSEATIKGIFNTIDDIKREKEIDKIDVIIGGPPCQAYSLVGRAQSSHMIVPMEDDPRNELYKMYVQFLKKYKPRMFVFENVAGIKTARGGQAFKNLQTYMKRVGYEIDYHELNAQDFGVLQSRKRVIIVGWLKGTGYEYPSFDVIHSKAEVWDLLKDLPPLTPGIEARRVMSGAMQKEKFAGLCCSGNHPHRPGAKAKICKKSVIPSQRGASNVYFTVTRNAISIPPWTNPINDIMGAQRATIETLVEAMGEEAGLSFAYQKYFEDKYSYEDFKAAYDRLSQNIKEFTELKEMEYAAITHHEDVEYQHDVKYFKAEEVALSESLKEYISRIIKIHRLREVRVLTGFTRLEAPEPEVDEQSHIVKLKCSSGEKWLPAVEINGEGVFIELNKKKINQWMQIETVKFRSDKYEECYAAYCQKKGWENFKPRNAEYVLLHTLSHMLIKEMSMQSGYSSSALHERIYSSENMCGILIYTGAADKEGSLGGLVELGGMNKFLPLLKGALENGLTCTTDPECFMKNPTSERLNGAACHSCTMISETACENGNRLLDRALVVPVPEHEEMGYFRELVRDLCGIQV